MTDQRQPPEPQADDAACACLRVFYRPEKHVGGTLSERWLCRGCGAEFQRKPSEPRADQPCGLTHCCVCRKTVFTCETYGEDADCDKPEHSFSVELNDGRWVCSSGCWDIAAKWFDQPAATAGRSVEQWRKWLQDDTCDDNSHVDNGMYRHSCDPCCKFALTEVAKAAEKRGYSIREEMAKDNLVAVEYDARQACAEEVAALGCPCEPDTLAKFGHDFGEALWCPTAIAARLRKGNSS